MLDPGESRRGCGPPARLYIKKFLVASFIASIATSAISFAQRGDHNIDYPVAASGDLGRYDASYEIDDHSYELSKLLHQIELVDVLQRDVPNSDSHDGRPPRTFVDCTASFEVTAFGSDLTAFTDIHIDCTGDLQDPAVEVPKNSRVRVVELPSCNFTVAPGLDSVNATCTDRIGEQFHFETQFDFNLVNILTTGLKIRTPISPRYSRNLTFTPQNVPKGPLVARWVEWYNPPICDQQPTPSDQLDCRHRHRALFIAYCAAGVAGLCGLVLVMMQCCTCVRWRGTMSRDLKSILTGQANSTAPMPLGPQIRFGVQRPPTRDVKAAGTDEVGSKYSQRRTTKGRDEEKGACGGGVGMGESSEAATCFCGERHGSWKLWPLIKPNLKNSAKINPFKTKTSTTTRPLPDNTEPLSRIPSLTLPKPVFSTIRLDNGLDVEKQNGLEGSDDIEANYAMLIEKAGRRKRERSKISWNSFF